MKIFAAVDIGGTTLKYGLVDETGTVLFRTEAPTHAELGGPKLVEKVTQIFTGLQSRTPVLDGLGISTAGVVDRKNGCIVYANQNIPQYAGTAWRSLLEKHFALPVNVLNDVHAAGEAEAWVGRGKNCDNFLCLTLGTGIGGALVLGGHAFSGAHDRAAALGYLNTQGGGKIYEQKASTHALVEETRCATKETDLDGKTVFLRAAQGVEPAAHCRKTWFQEVAKGIANAVLCYDPELVLIGGGISAQGDALLGPLYQALAEYLPLDFWKQVKLQKAQCGNDAGLIGAVRGFVQGKPNPNGL